MLLAAAVPGAGGAEELVRQVGLLDVGEAGGAQQVLVVCAAGADGGRAGAGGSAVVGVREAAGVREAVLVAVIVRVGEGVLVALFVGVAVTDTGPA